MLAFQALALVAPILCVGAEARHIIGTGAAKAAAPPRPVHAEARHARGETDPVQPVAHAEYAMAAVRLLRAAGGGEQKHEREKGRAME
ncbi:MAG TPA: hypothetical protein VHT03_10540 [Rhizomicrobium sp.]|nr:hypothetical protein [Rhizomicrobium sp.]